jgi:hypothetical protein
MHITLNRVQIDPDVTIGDLAIDGRHLCWTCEDPVREIEGQPVEAWKIHGKTAIPFGTYNVVITRSARFGVDMPLLQGVPGFAGIRIHTGNTVADTEGCLLPGFVRYENSVGQSRLAYEALFERIRDALERGETVSISIGREA